MIEIVIMLWVNGRQPVKVLKSLNDRQSGNFLKFYGIEGAHPIQIIICGLTTAKGSRSTGEALRDDPNNGCGGD